MNHPKQAAFYFDYISPYAYLLWHRLNAENSELSGRLELCHRPVLFAGLLNHWGQKGPAEIEAKRIHTYRQVVYLAKQYDIPFRMPDAHPFNPLAALRLTIAAGNTPEAISTVFTCIWVDGHRPDDPAGFAAIVDALAIEGGESAAREKIASSSVKQELQKNGSDALADGVFGVPTIVAEGELFWGVDSLDMLVHFLDNPGYYRGDEMRRIHDIVPSATRAH
ncbi:MAG: 2-hydroxychromene-2-carboxylate isomerase [Halieaceae bacterium]